jgi:hypothetical protein
MPNLRERVARLEAERGPSGDRKVVRGFSLAEAEEREAELRAAGFTGPVLKIVREIIDPPAR